MAPAIKVPLLAGLAIITGAAATGGGDHGATITIDANTRYQDFDGMGFAQAFQRCTQIYGADGLSEANTERVLDLLFSNENGAGLTILRNAIGSSLTNPYDLMKTIEPNSPGSPDAQPHYDWEGTIKPGFGLDSGQLRMTKDAISRGVQSVYADAWSAPSFMKNNHNDSNGGHLCGVPGFHCESGDWRQAYANYLVQYLKFYKQEGIDINYVGFLNEPDLTEPYASMRSNGQQAASFLEILHPTLHASGLDTEIACCDGSGWEEQRMRLTDIEAHGAEYTLGLVTAHRILFASHITICDAEEGEGLTWANHIQQAYAVSNVTGFLYWIGADNTTSNSALILLDGDTVNVSARLWAFAQFSRFVNPGAARIDATSSGSRLNVTAFQNADGSTAVQVINNSGKPHNLNLRGLSGRSAQIETYLTDNGNDLTPGIVQAYKGQIRDSIPAYAMKSYVGT